MISKNEEMNIRSLWAVILSQLKEQGFSFLILIGVVLYFHEQNTVLDNRILDCNQNTIEIYRSQNQRFMEVLERNSRALESIGRYMEKNPQN